MRGIYSFAALPDLTFFFKADLEVSLNRILDGRPQLKYFEAGMDLRLSTDPYESFRIFQGRILEQYLAMSSEFNFMIIDANQSIEAQQNVVRSLVAGKLDLASLRRWKRPAYEKHPPSDRRSENVSPPTDEALRNRTRVIVPHKTPRRFYGHGIPGVDADKLAGQLIVVEGADGSGRSTQIRLLVEWLEGNGHSTVQVGLKRSIARERGTRPRAGRKHSRAIPRSVCFTPRILPTSSRTSFCPPCAPDRWCWPTATFTRSWRATSCAAWTRNG